MECKMQQENVTVLQMYETSSLTMAGVALTKGTLEMSRICETKGQRDRLSCMLPGRVANRGMAYQV